MGDSPPQKPLSHPLDNPNNLLGAKVVSGSEPVRRGTTHSWGSSSRIVTADGLVLRDLWRTEEDEMLRRMVHKHGPFNWAHIATYLPHRTSKQCRERWHNHLDPNVRKGPWTDEEDNALLWLYKTHGPKWARIAGEIAGRTDNSVKNRFHTFLKRRVESGAIDLNAVERPRLLDQRASTTTTTTTTTTPTQATHISESSSPPPHESNSNSTQNSISTSNSRPSVGNNNHRNNRSTSPTHNKHAPHNPDRAPPRKNPMDINTILLSTEDDGDDDDDVFSPTTLSDND